MKKTQKIITLIVVLLAPISVFIFLKEFGNNQFELPIYYAAGNPLGQCAKQNGEQHKVQSSFIDNGIISLPTIFAIAGDIENEYSSDLENVLSKYPAIKVWEIYKGENNDNQNNVTTLSFDDASYHEFINCELVLGEDKWLEEGIPFKYVLVDKEARIRGYIECTNLKEIERLDTELDILINY